MFYEESKRTTTTPPNPRYVPDVTKPSPVTLISVTGTSHLSFSTMGAARRFCNLTLTQFEWRTRLTTRGKEICVGGQVYVPIRGEYLCEPPTPETPWV